MTSPTQALEEGGESGAPDAADDNASESQSGTFFLPKDFLGGKMPKAGEKITLTVVGTDEDGDVEVSMGDANSSESWQGDLEKSLAEPQPQGGA